MDRGYEAYCVADPLFYDSVGAGTANEFAIARRPVAAGWRARPSGEWLVLDAPGVTLPPQGWKIHVSGCLNNAERILDTVRDYCVVRRLCFKFLRSPRALLMRNAKYAPRAASGKLVTIYPADEATLRQALEDLDAKLGGEQGPYILSDLRWSAGPLYVRFGAFAMMHCVGATGQLVPALAAPDGTLVPDRREPVFTVPDWVTLPDFLAPHLAARGAAVLADLPYRIERVLHFSNGGGLYVGADTRSGVRVALKEARPYAGLDGRGDDAVTRLRREQEMLERLATVPGVPRIHGAFALDGHEFLVQEFIDGSPLNQVLAQRLPLLAAAGDDRDAYARHTEWAMAIHGQVRETVEALHTHGVVHGDLHLFNLMVRPDGGVVLIDFEVATPLGEHRPAGLGNQGFTAPAGRTGTAADQYALACLGLALFLPITTLLPLAPGKARHLAEVIAEHYPVPRAFLDEVVHVIEPRPQPSAPPAPWPRAATDPNDWRAVRAQLTQAILGSATPERIDRLFPGDIEQFHGAGLGLAHGAAGVLYTLAECAAKREPGYEQWLCARALDPEPDTRLGYLDGLHGAAFVLDHLGHRQAALDVLDRCLGEQWQALGLDLAGGISGIGLTLLHLAERTGEPALGQAARRAVELTVERLGAVDQVAEVSGGGYPYAGLTRGACGPALLLLRMYDRTGDSHLLDLAATAIEQDLRRCVRCPDGSLQVNEGWRTMPYLARGSVGIGLVIDEFLARRPDERFAVAGAAIAVAARSALYVQSGLFNGRAGIALYLSLHAGATDPELTRQIERLAWHAIPYAGGVAFPGEQLLRLSMDVATGTAGVLLALAVARSGRTVAPLVLGPGWQPRTPEPSTQSCVDGSTQQEGR